MAAFVSGGQGHGFLNRFCAGSAGFIALPLLSVSFRVTSRRTLRTTHVRKEHTMKKQNKLSLKVRDLTPLKDVTGGKHRRQGSHAAGFVQRGDEFNPGVFGLRRIR